MSFYKNVGSPLTELNIRDFEPPYPGGLPECYKHYGENCHLKYYGKDYYFRVRIPDLDKYEYISEFEIKDYLFSTAFQPFNTNRKNKCDNCIFLNINRNKTGIHCLLRRGKSSFSCCRCIFPELAYFEPLNLAKDTQ